MCRRFDQKLKCKNSNLLFAVGYVPNYWGYILMQWDCRDYPSLGTCQETSGDGRKLVTFSVLV